jgi:predicted secreted protein
MPDNKVNGRDIIVTFDAAGGSSYKAVVCLTSNTITNSVTSLDASSKCGNAFQPGVKFESSVNGEGFLVDPDTGTPSNAGYPELYAAFTQRKIGTIKFGKASPTTGDAVYGGTAFVTELELVAADDELTTFTVTFTCAAPPFTQTVTY